MSGRHAASQGGGDDGAAPVDFVLLAGLLTAVFLMIIQLGIALHVRNVLASAAAEGARYGANADFADHSGAADLRTREIITTELSGHFADGVTSTVVGAGNDAVVEVDVTAPMPLFGFWGSARTIHVQGHALQEGG